MLDLVLPNPASINVMMAACKAGLGLVSLPSMYVESSIEKGELVPVLSCWHQNESPCHLVHPPGRFRLQRVNALAEWLIDAMRNSHNH